jgi:hypothetical protein
LPKNSAEIFFSILPNGGYHYRQLTTAPTLAEFLNWMPSTEPPDDGAAEDIQESAEAALAATSQGI